ncbi:MAG: hypothetical protein ACK4FL_03915 [Microgenomates group bacterium]
MRRKNTSKIFELINDFKNILFKKPPLSQMFEEVKMMRFKIHPLSGDINAFNLNNTKLIEILWSLGKLDEFFHHKFKKISTKDKQIFIQTFNKIFWQLQEQLKNVNLKANEFPSDSPLLELEVYKEQKNQKLN